MTYEVYKILHIASVFLFLSFASASFFMDAKSEGPARLFKILIGVMSLVMLVTGFGLVSKIGAGFPLWVICKTIIWLVLVALGPIAIKRFADCKRQKAYMIFMALAIVAVILVELKPL